MEPSSGRGSRKGKPCSPGFIASIHVIQHRTKFRSMNQDRVRLQNMFRFPRDMVVVVSLAAVVAVTLQYSNLQLNLQSGLTHMWGDNHSQADNGP